MLDRDLTSRLFAGAALAIAVVSALGNAALAEGQKTFTGKSVAVGQGVARVVLATNAEGKPAAIGVLLDAAALKGLPAATATQHEWDYVLPMPKDAPWTGIDHVYLNWNPQGHDPQGIYTAPHFDVHFYSIPSAAREAITFKGADKSGLAQPAAALLPKGFVVPPDTAVEKMGVHGLDPKGPEFRGRPFSHTFIYGYHKGTLVFVEPMVTKAFLESKPDVTTRIAVPAAYSMPGYYPTRYRVAYDSGRDQYVVMIAGLKEWKAP